MQEDVYQGDGLNLYAYCDNNPVTYYDPSGYMQAQNSYEQAQNGKGEGSEGEGGVTSKPDDNLPNRREALNEAKDRAGVPRSQQPDRQWQVGDNLDMKGHDTANYSYDPNPTSHGRYYEYDTPNGKRVIVDHTNDGVNHIHAGKPKGNSNSHTYDFKTDRYQKIDGADGDHHIYYRQ